MLNFLSLLSERIFKIYWKSLLNLSCRSATLECRGRYLFSFSVCCVSVCFLKWVKRSAIYSASGGIDSFEPNWTVATVWSEPLQRFISDRNRQLFAVIFCQPLHWFGSDPDGEAGTIGCNPYPWDPVQKEPDRVWKPEPERPGGARGHGFP